MKRVAILASVVLLAAGLVAAQDEPTETPARMPPPSPRSPRPALRDPTEPDEAVRASAGTGGLAPVTSAIPPVALRGLVVGRGRGGVALIEIAGRLHRGHEGTTIVLASGTGSVDAAGRPGVRPLAGPSGLRVRVVSIVRDEVTLELLPAGTRVTLR